MLTPLVLSLFALAHCSPAPQQAREALTELNPDIVEEKLRNTQFHLSDSLNEFSSKIFDTLVDGEDGNVVISPLSLHMALAMTYFGSPSESRTHREVASLLGMETQFNEDYLVNFLQMINKYQNLRSEGSSAVFDVANKIYVARDTTLNGNYRTLMRTFFQSDVEKVTFGLSRTTDLINDFIEDKTNGKIRDALEEIDSLTLALIVNVVYFKDNWRYQFDKANTKPKQFFVEPDQSYTHDKTMNIEAELRSGTVSELDARVLELPYEDDNFRMLIVLPNHEDDLLRVQRKLLGFDFSRIDRKLSEAPTVVQLPRFKIDFSADSLVDGLKSLGVRDLFDETRADLSDMLPDDDIAVTGMVHKAVLEVNEEGSEAAAVTAVLIGTRTVGRQPKQQVFVVDRPFFFVIQDRALGVNLFQGRVVDPEGRRKIRG